MNENDSDSTLHTDEDLRETMFNENISEEEEEETSKNFYLGTDDNSSTKTFGTDNMYPTKSNHKTWHGNKHSSNGMENYIHLIGNIPMTSLLQSTRTLHCLMEIIQDNKKFQKFRITKKSHPQNESKRIWIFSKNIHTKSKRG